MKPPRGVYEENGYAKIRIWLTPKYKLDGTEAKPYRKSMGPWNNANIQRAKNHIDEVRAKFEKGVNPGPEIEILGFPEGCDIYHKRHWLENPKRTARATQNVGYILNGFKRTWKERSHHSILPSEIREYVKTRASEGVEVSTVNHELTILSSMFNEIAQLVNLREIGPYVLPTKLTGETFNPVSVVDRASTVHLKRKRIATDEEIIKVINYCNAKDPDMLRAIERTYITGLRKTNVESVNGKAEVSGIVSKTGGRKTFEFSEDFSDGISYKNFPRRWNALRDACDMRHGPKRFTWHDWRHQSGTTLKKLGFSLSDIQEFYDHSSLQQTKTYVHPGPEVNEAKVAALKGNFAALAKNAQPAAPKDPTRKRCLGCNELKPLGEYGKHSAFKSGLNSRCRACNYKATTERRRLNPAMRAKEYAGNRSRAVSSVVEHFPHTEGATGSSPVLPTISESTKRYLKNADSIKASSVSNSVSNGIAQKTQ